MEKYRTAGQADDDNMAHAQCLLEAYGYTHTRARSEYAERNPMLTHVGCLC